MTSEGEHAGKKPAWESASEMGKLQQRASATLESRLWKEGRLGRFLGGREVIVEAWEQSWERTGGTREAKRDGGRGETLRRLGGKGITVLKGSLPWKERGFAYNMEERKGGHLKARGTGAGKGDGLRG